MIDGEEIKKFSLKELRSQIAIVMQEPLLFNKSIADNIKYGNEYATNNQILSAAE